MAWALRFDGVNDYATTSAWLPTDQGDWSAEVAIITGADIVSDQFICGHETGVGVRTWKLFINNSRFGVIHNSNWTGAGILNTGTILTNTQYTVKVTLTGGILSIDLDGIPQASSPRATLSATSYLTEFGYRGTGSSFLEADILTALFDDPVTPLNSRLYDATASSHGAGTPIWLDIVSSNNATGVNMPTDGSAWIDLGGGGALIPVIMNTYRQRRV